MKPFPQQLLWIAIAFIGGVGVCMLTLMVLQPFSEVSLEHSKDVVAAILSGDKEAAAAVLERGKEDPKLNHALFIENWGAKAAVILSFIALAFAIPKSMSFSAIGNLFTALTAGLALGTSGFYSMDWLEFFVLVGVGLTFAVVILTRRLPR
ncbi:MAG: hypothetical protein AAGF53_01850 [Pseudomonadota bacterium]